jgi:hypothetical protein
MSAWKELCEDTKSFLLLLWILLGALLATTVYTYQSIPNKEVTFADPGLLVLASAFTMSSVLVFMAGIIFIST